MEKIRVLVVDDSLVVRRALRECFRTDPEIEVVGVAEDGARALEQIRSLLPDVMTLDIEMPVMDGLETLRTLRDQGSELPIIMFSRHTTAGATATMEALELGASDIVAKPEADGSGGGSVEAVKRQLATRIRALGRKAQNARNRPDTSANEPAPQVEQQELEPFQAPRSVQAIGIAISTGGPSALIELVTGLSADLHVPIFVTQHMPEMFTRFLAERLSVRGVLPVHEAAEGMLVKPGNIYIAPGNFHLEVGRQQSEIVINVSQAPHENSCRPSADVMYRSLVKLYGARLLGIVMTGMGQDGKRGCELIKSAGGCVVAQDEASSLVWGMPRAVVTANLHDAVVPLSGIASLINATRPKGKKGES